MAKDQGTFGRGLQKFIQNNLPYRSPASIIDDVTQQNPKFKSFYKAGSLRKELLAQHSILAPKVPESSHPIGSFLADKAYNELMYATLDVDKYRRVRDYRTMSQFAEVADALDEICDEFLNEDEHGNIISLDFRSVVDFDPLVTKQINQEFEKLIEGLVIKKVEMKQENIDAMVEQGPAVLAEVDEALKSYFGEYEVVSSEELLMVPIDNSEYKFKGFVDAVVKVDDTYHLFDWKTCSWGWDSRRRADKMTTYQLTLYKYFFCKKHDIDPDQVETHFALLKRTAKKNRVEIFRVTSGEKKTKNALKLLEHALYNISKKRYIKNRLSCRGCDLYKTKHCP